jgi:hypothetical protein
MKHSLRRAVAGLTMTMSLLLTACSDQPTEVPLGPQVAAPEGASLVDPVASCPASSIESQIKALAPAGALRTSLVSRFKSIPTKVAQRTGTAARDKMFALVDAILDAYYAGQFGGTSAAIQAKVLTLISSLYCFVRLDSPTLPAGSLGPDGVVGVVTPNSPTTTLVVPSEHAAVTIPAGAAPSPTTIVVRILPDEPPPLLTSLNQYPYFYEFSSFPEVTFNLDVLAGICPRDNLDAINANLRLAHNVGANFGDVEVLPRPTGAVQGLDCADLPESASKAGRGLGVFAWSGWRWMDRTLAPLGRALLPEPLHAATHALLTLGVGGTTRKFSPFGIVDITSNPASLDFNPDAGAFGSLAALPLGSVTAPSVVLTSERGDPIPNWPVRFSVASGGGTINGGTVPVTVVTGPNGVASLTSWNLGAAGTNTVSATPTPVAGEPISSTDAYQPAGAFAPASLTFTATAAGEIDYLTPGYRYLISNTSRVFPVGVVDFDDPAYPDSGWLTGNAAFGFSDPATNCPLITAPGGVKVTWPEGTDILLRRPFTVPAGTTSAEVKVAVDNDIRVFVNGTEITSTGGEVDEGSGFVEHEGCPTADSFTFTAGGLVHAGVNWLAILARDRGGSTYVDADVVPIIEEGGGE